MGNQLMRVESPTFNGDRHGLQADPQQQAGILAADAVCREHGIPAYYDFVRAAAALCVDIREGRSTKRSHVRLSMVLEGLRNESADPRPVVTPREES